MASGRYSLDAIQRRGNSTGIPTAYGGSGLGDDANILSTSRNSTGIPRNGGGLLLTDIDISEDEISIQGAEGLDLKIKGRIPDKMALYICLLIASFLGLDQLGVLGP